MTRGRRRRVGAIDARAIVLEVRETRAVNEDERRARGEKRRIRFDRGNGPRVGRTRARAMCGLTSTRLARWVGAQVTESYARDRSLCVTFAACA